MLLEQCRPSQRRKHENTHSHDWRHKNTGVTRGITNSFDSCIFPHIHADTHTHTHTHTHTSWYFETGSRGCLRIACLCQLERCWWVVCRYINTREKGGGEEEKKTKEKKKDELLLLNKFHSPRYLAAGQSKGKKITKSGPSTRANTRTQRSIIAAEESTTAIPCSSSISIALVEAAHRPRRTRDYERCSENGEVEEEILRIWSSARCQL